jgi:hypothetical protein
MKIYIAGPMRGVFGFNALGFQYWQRRIEQEFQYEVVNPADLDRSLGFMPNVDGQLHEGDPDYEDIMERDIEALSKCDAIFMMRDWSTSEGATRELIYATRWSKTIYYSLPHSLQVQRPHST